MAWMGYVIMVLGAASEANAQHDAGKREKVLANFKATQLEGMAGEERSKSQRVAMERRRRARLAKSRALALAAASGAGACDVGKR